MYYRAEEASESSSGNHKPDMRIKTSISPDVESLEILFLECSRPIADIEKFLSDWVKLVRMCRDAHVKMFQEMTKNQFGQLRKSQKR